MKERAGQGCGRIAVLALAVLWSSGCASYTSRMASARRSFVEGDYPSALAEITDDECEDSTDGLLALLERGTIHQAAGEYEASNRDFEKAYGVFRDFDRRADVSLRDAGNEAAAAVTNETVLPYKGKGYEKLLLYCYKALNYLMLGDVQGARVERFRFDQQRKEEARRHQEELEEARKEAREQNVNQATIDRTGSDLLQSFGPEARARASRGINLYLSAFGSYLSSIIYDIEGEFSEAAIDCSRVLEQCPEFVYAGRDAYTYGEGSRVPLPGEEFSLAERGDLVVFLQCGLAPVKREVYIPIAIDNFIVSLAFAVYDTVPTKIAGARVLVDGQDWGTTLLLDDVEAQAIQTLVDDIPITVTRQIVRAVIKGTAANAAADANGWVGLLFDIYNMASEQADLRSWLLLPKNIQGFRAYPPQGARKVEVQVLGPAGEVLGKTGLDLELRPDRSLIVAVRAIGYTPELPGGMTLTTQWRSIPRVPLGTRPRPRL
ncbi:MAG TPA: hypothetical protein PLI51_01115 [bacterium]|nr:hypothetical protein [bacterium]HPQ65313.1 hypothetical protein [bacterium]